MLGERMNRTEASVTGTSPAVGVGLAGLRCPRHQELTLDDSDLEHLVRDTNQGASVAKTLDGVTGPGCFELGQDGFNVDEYKKSVIRAVEARLVDEATVKELDLRLKIVAADFYHALILFCKESAEKMS